MAAVKGTRAQLAFYYSIWNYLELVKLFRQNFNVY